MSHSLMTDVINGKNRKRDARLKMVLPIFTQRLSAVAGYLFYKNGIWQNERRFKDFIQIGLL